MATCYKNRKINYNRIPCLTYMHFLPIVNDIFLLIYAWKYEFSTFHLFTRDNGNLSFLFTFLFRKWIINPVNRANFSKRLYWFWSKALEKLHNFLSFEKFFNFDRSVSLSFKTCFKEESFARSARIFFLLFKNLFIICLHYVANQLITLNSIQ